MKQPNLASGENPVAQNTDEWYPPTGVPPPPPSGMASLLRWPINQLGQLSTNQRGEKRGRGWGGFLYKASTPVRGPPCRVRLSRQLGGTASSENLTVAETQAKLDLRNRKSPNQRNGGYIIDWGCATRGTGGDPGWRRSTSKPPGRRH